MFDAFRRNESNLPNRSGIPDEDIELMRRQFEREMENAGMDDKQKAEARLLFEITQTVPPESSVKLAFGLLTGLLSTGGTDSDAHIDVIHAIAPMIKTAGPQVAYEFARDIIAGIALAANLMAAEKREEMPEEVFERFAGFTPTTVAEELVAACASAESAWEDIKDTVMNKSEIDSLEEMFGLDMENPPEND